MVYELISIFVLKLVVWFSSFFVKSERYGLAKHFAMDNSTDHESTGCCRKKNINAATSKCATMCIAYHHVPWMHSNMSFVHQWCDCAKHAMASFITRFHG